MTIDEAIFYILTRALDLEFRGYDREAVAQRLGIAALELVKHYRVAHPSKCTDILPGETKEPQRS